MKRGKEVSWRRSWVIALLGQMFFVMLLLEEHLDHSDIKDYEMLGTMYFAVPLIGALIWKSWKVFLAAISIPFLLVLGETLYYIIRLKLAS